MKKENYFTVFAKMTEEAKIFTLQRALDIHPDKVKEILQKLEQELKLQETLLHSTHAKANIKEFELINKIKLLRAKSKRKKEGKLAKLIRLSFFYEIQELRKQGFGWRKISEYIRVNHHKKISYVTIRNVFESLQKQLEGKQEQ